MKARLPEYMVASSGVHNEEQLAEFMAKVQSIREPFEFVQWKAYYFEDYSPTESLFVYKVHHSLADGIAIVLLNSNLVDEPRLADFPMLTPRIGWL